MAQKRLEDLKAAADIHRRSYVRNLGFGEGVDGLRSAIDSRLPAWEKRTVKAVETKGVPLVPNPYYVPFGFVLPPEYRKISTKKEENKREVDSGVDKSAMFNTGSSVLKQHADKGGSAAQEALEAIRRNRAGAQGRNNPIEQESQENGVPERYRVLVKGDLTEEILANVLHMQVTAGNTVKAEDIAGLYELKKAVRKLINALKRPDLHRGLQAPPKGVLLFGPAGTGKTTVARWLAGETSAAFFEVAPASLISKFYGETESIIKGLFKVAELIAPSVIFVDEVDAVLGRRKDTNDESTVRMKNMILQAMDGFSSGEGVVLIGATNRPESLDDAALRRFQKRILVGLPDATAREDHLLRLTNDRSLFEQLEKEDLAKLVSVTEGWNCSDMKSLAAAAAAYPMDEIYDRFGFDIDRIPEKELNSKRAVRSSDFLNASQFVRPSCPAGAEEQHRQWADNHAAV